MFLSPPISHSKIKMIRREHGGFSVGWFWFFSPLSKKQEFKCYFFGKRKMIQKLRSFTVKSPKSLQQLSHLYQRHKSLMAIFLPKRFSTEQKFH